MCKSLEPPSCNSEGVFPEIGVQRSYRWNCCMLGRIILELQKLLMSPDSGKRNRRERESENSVTVTHNFLAKNCDTFLMLDNYVCKIKNLCM